MMPIRQVFPMPDLPVPGEPETNRGALAAPDEAAAGYRPEPFPRQQGGVVINHRHSPCCDVSCQYPSKTELF
jgi:hypothetical protein